MKKSVLSLNNKPVGDIELDESIFGVKQLPDLIHQYLRYQNAKSRQGTHKTKTRSEVSGRSKKPFSQKLLNERVRTVLRIYTNRSKEGFEKNNNVILLNAAATINTFISLRIDTMFF